MFAATAEVRATIVNTEGARHVSFSEQVTKRNVLDAAYQELDHYNVPTQALGAKAVTKKIWIPDALFANEANLLKGLVFGDGVFVNAYQIGVTAFGNAGKGQFARYGAEIIGHRVRAPRARTAVTGQARQRPSIRVGVNPLLHRDHARRGPARGRRIRIRRQGQRPGRFYEFDKVKNHTAHRHEAHQLSPH
jgi:hypothetical protein